MRIGEFMERKDTSSLEKSNNYVINHRNNVKKAFNILKPKLIGFQELDKLSIDTISQHIEEHDLSKFKPEESLPYARFFWGIKSDNVIEEFKIATKLHKSRNLHHPEYWMNENGETNEMPLIYIVEMVCDWWSFGLMQKKPDEIFDFYANNKEKYKFSYELTEIIESLLTLVQQSINELNITQTEEIFEP